jgi:hypothetical protein
MWASSKAVIRCSCGRRMRKAANFCGTCGRPLRSSAKRIKPLSRSALSVYLLAGLSCIVQIFNFFPHGDHIVVIIFDLIFLALLILWLMTGHPRTRVLLGRLGFRFAMVRRIASNCMSIVLLIAFVDAVFVLSGSDKTIARPIYASCSSQRTRRTLFDAVVDKSPGIGFVGVAYSENYPGGESSYDYTREKASLSCGATESVCIAGVRREMHGHFFDLPIYFCLSRLGEITSSSFLP